MFGDVFLVEKYPENEHVEIAILSKLKCWKIRFTCIYMFLKEMVTVQDFSPGKYLSFREGYHFYETAVGVLAVHEWNVLRKACGQRCFGTSGPGIPNNRKGKMTQVDVTWW